jgi:Icc-related predicted phosphoesterase
LHRDRVAARRLVAAAADVDCVIGAGDFSTRRQGIEDTLGILAEIDKPAVLVPGNGESVEELRQAATGWPAAHVLHASGCRIAGVDFWGVGGGIPITPFGNWSYDFDEQQAAAMLAACPAGGVLVVHSPPLDTVDHDDTGRIRGSQAIRDAVEAKLPKLVVCGHIHGDWEKQVELGPTRIVNAGPRGVLLELD